MTVAVSVPPSATGFGAALSTAVARGKSLSITSFETVAAPAAIVYASLAVISAVTVECSSQSSSFTVRTSSVCEVTSAAIVTVLLPELAAETIAPDSLTSTMTSRTSGADSSRLTVNTTGWRSVTSAAATSMLTSGFARVTVIV